VLFISWQKNPFLPFSPDGSGILLFWVSE